MYRHRNIVIDIMKGLGITAIVWHHSFTGTGKTPVVLNNGFNNMVMSFVMPMFFVVSGYLIFGKMNKVKQFIDKFKRFIIPCLLFLVLMTVEYFTIYGGLNITNCISFYFTNIGNGFNFTSLWFLWTLILCFAIAFVIENAKIGFKKIPIWVICFITIVSLFLIMPKSNLFLGICILSNYGIFFLIGYCVKAYQSKLIRFKNLMYGSLIAFPLVGYLTNWMTKWETIIMNNGQNGFPYINATGHMAILLGLEVFMMAILGTMFLWSVSKIISKVWYARDLFAYLGIASIGIYLFNSIFAWTDVIKNPWIATVVWTIVCVGIYELAKRNKITKKLMGIV
jgi:fucose 4-O-acetylase-like acetyltransferase